MVYWIRTHQHALEKYLVPFFGTLRSEPGRELDDLE
jgi:hypothetical protein